MTPTSPDWLRELRLGGGLALFCLLYLAGGLSRVAADLPAFGPLYQRFQLTLEPGERSEALGPLFYHQESGEPGDWTELWGVPPLFSYQVNEDLDYASLDLLWKVASFRRYGPEYRFHLLQLINFSGGGTQSETNVHRISLFPFYFQQTSLLPELNYWALFPLYGTIKNRLFRDEVTAIAFPLYGRSRKRDVVTHNFLYPIFHLRRGDGLRGWQFLPLAGYEHKDLTTRTNHWGDPIMVGGHEKFFALWPLILGQDTGLGTTNPARQRSVLPLYSSFRSPLRDSVSYGWPLGITHTVDREKKFEEWGMPWPLVVRSWGEGKNVTRFWPLYSDARNSNQVSRWVMWPVYKVNEFHTAEIERDRMRILFFLYSDTSVRHLQAGTTQRQWDLWPLFTTRREHDGRRRFQALALLEAFLPNNSGVERNLSPLWSVWRAEDNPTTGASSQSLLWNLFRREVGPKVKKCSILFGLFQYQSAPTGSRWRLFYIPVGSKKDAPTTPDS